MYLEQGTPHWTLHCHRAKESTIIYYIYIKYPYDYSVFIYMCCDYDYNQEPMTAEGPKERPMVVPSNQLSARHVQIRQTTKF